MDRAIADLNSEFPFLSELISNAVASEFPRTEIGGIFTELSESLSFDNVCNFFDNWRHTSSAAISRFGEAEEKNHAPADTKITGKLAEISAQLLDDLVNAPNNETWFLRFITNEEEFCVMRLSQNHVNRMRSTKPFRLLKINSTVPFVQFWIRSYFEWTEERPWIVIIPHRGFETEKEWDDYAYAVGKTSGAMLSMKNITIMFTHLVLDGNQDPQADILTKISDAIKNGTRALARPITPATIPCDENESQIEEEKIVHDTEWLAAEFDRIEKERDKWRDEMIETQYKKEKDALIEKYEAEILILKNIIEGLNKALARSTTP
jgi:hypothetical protein